MPHPEAQGESVPPRGGKLSRNVRLLGLASLLNDVASEMIYPLMPQFLIGVLKGNKFQLGLIEGVADSASSLLKPWMGAWSDRAGRRKSFVVLGYLASAVSRPLIGLAAAPWHLLAARSADRIGKGIRTAPRDALVAESSEDAMRGRAFGFQRAMDHLGAAFGPLLGALFLWIAPNELRTLFLLSIVPGLAVAVLLVLGLRERAAVSGGSAAPPVATGCGETVAHPAVPPIDGNFRLYLFSLVVFTLGNSSDAFLLLRAGELGVPTAVLPLLWCLFHVVKSSGNLVGGRLVDRWGPRPMILAGWLLYAAVYLGFALAHEAWQVWVCFLAYGIHFALTEPAERTFVTHLVGPRGKGRAFGWFNLAIGIATFPASVAFGWLYDRFGALAAFGWGAGLALAAAALLAGVNSARGRIPDRGVSNKRQGDSS